MSNSRSKRQVVILDCCFSGAFAEGWSAKDDGFVDVKSQLGGEGRAVLTSSTSTQYSFEQEGSDFSTYTRYLVEGIETGAADLDGDGVVAIDELHEYAKGKVQEVAPAMKPEIYAIKEGYKIYLSQAPIEDPKLMYRKEVEHCASRGEISAISRYTLDVLRESLDLLPEEAVAIEDEVLKPYQEYHKKCQRYEQVLVEAIKREHYLSNDTKNELKRLQRVLKLRDEDIAQIEAQITSQKTAISPEGESAAVIQSQTIFRSETVAPVKLSNEAGATSQTQTPTSPNIRLPRVPTIAVPVVRNPKLLIGGGIVTAVALIFIFLVKTPQSGQQLDSTPTASPTVSSGVQLSAEDFDARGNEKYNNGDYKGAIEDFNQAIILKPDYAQAYYDRGWAKKDSGDEKGAIADFDLAIKLNPNYAEAYRGRGIAKSNLGDKQGALADFQKAAELYQKQGKTQDYQDALKRVKKLQ